MNLLDLTLGSPADNLALDEALLEQAEQLGRPLETLRLWEAPQPFVVLGRSSRLAEETDLQQCRRHGLPILRRCSGGASVVVGPGCLMYAVVLSYKQRPQLHSVTEAHRLVMGTVTEALRRLSLEVEFQGTSDLTLYQRKFSGNSLRCKRTHLLYHGTILYRFPLDLISKCLRTPPRQPDYRQAREHGDFVTNLPIDAPRLREALANAWQVESRLATWPEELTAELSRTRYCCDCWNHRW